MSEIKLCECGCGQPAAIAKGSSPKRGTVRGAAMRFAPHHGRYPVPRPVIIDGVYCIPLTGGKFARVDGCDVANVGRYRWLCNKDGYAVRNRPRNLGGGRIHMHREIMQAPDGMQTDHINGDRLDNRRANLRICNGMENARNRGVSARHIEIPSRYKGVSWERRAARWQAQIGCDGKKFHLGLFATEEEAARAYDAKARELHGDFARLNFP